MVVDDHPVVRKGLQACLSKQERLRVVGEAADGEEALQRARELNPDIVLMDISMPRMNGLAVTEQLRKDRPSIKVLVLSIHNNREFSGVLWQKGIGNALREWDGWSHDWPYWENMIRAYVGGHD